MKRYLNITVVLSLMLLLGACDVARESSIRRKLAGPKKLSRYIWKKQDSNGEFTKVIYDTTDMATMIFWDNDDAVFNNINYKGGNLPAGWGFAGVGYKGIPVWWYADWEEGKTLTLWSQNAMEEKFRTTYTLSHNATYSKIILETVYVYNNENYLEILELEEAE